VSTPETPGELLAMQILAIPDFPGVPVDAVSNVMELLTQGGTTPEEYQRIALAILDLLIVHHEEACDRLSRVQLTELDARLALTFWAGDLAILRQAAAMVDNLAMLGAQEEET
jgi:tRNA threonylcarbamoyladenosine modification (KEOPS) complex  Pcc1 subunit